MASKYLLMDPTGGDVRVIEPGDAPTADDLELLIARFAASCGAETVEVYRLLRREVPHV